MVVEGALFPHSEKLSTPFKHVVLRGLSFVLGRRLIALLKRVLIFKRGGGDAPRLVRRIRRDGQKLEIVDTLAGLRPDDLLTRAPRASKRHVASADSFHAQDLAMHPGVALDEQRSEGPDGLVITTRYAPR